MFFLKAKGHAPFWGDYSEKRLGEPRLFPPGTWQQQVDCLVLKSERLVLSASAEPCDAVYGLQDLRYFPLNNEVIQGTAIGLNGVCVWVYLFEGTL